MSAKTNVGSRSRDNNGEVIKNHHKKAFECISQALRIDEDDAGVLVVMFSVSFSLSVSGSNVGVDLTS